MKFPGKRHKEEVSLEEVLLDSSNLPSFNVHRMEGHIELPLAKGGAYVVGGVSLLILVVFFSQLFKLQVIEGAEHARQSEENRLLKTLIIAERGAIYDRNGERVAWNEHDADEAYEFPLRAYTDRDGFGQLIGYVSYPKKDAAGFYFRTEYLGRNGVEETYSSILKGENGERFVEVNALGDIISENVVREPVAGSELTLSLDTELSEAMHDLIATTTQQNGFRSGAGAMMNVHTGEVVALTSYPSYDPEVLADGDDAELIEAYNTDERFPFLNKVVSGLYTPGSVIKPFLAYGALAEKVIDPMKIIYGNGSLVVPNPYDPDNPTVFKDWRVHGPMTLRDAIAFSSNVYFYIIGGGFEDQEGLGIARIKKYMNLFGLGKKTGIALSGEQSGTVPDPEWKREVFDDDWRLGDTYLTSIGQFGFQVTPLQLLRAYVAIANGGKLVTPHVVKGEESENIDLELDQAALQIVQEGMRRTVVQSGGTARALERSDLKIAAKSGTAEVGASKMHVNSWIAGYYPYDAPEYAFILMMEFGPRSNTVGASSVMGKVFDWMAKHRPEFLLATEE